MLQRGFITMTCERCLKEITNEDDHGLYKCPLENRFAAVGIATDDIPGGIIINHGAGLAGKKFYSKTELKRAANEHGWKIAGDTPGKPYKVNWSGVQKSQGGLPVKNE